MIIVVGFPAACWAQDAANCATCHPAEAEQFARSVHTSLRCQECHGGENSYRLSKEDAQKYLQAGKAKLNFAGSTGDAGVEFDHGASFSGKPARVDIPKRCGSCHADVERMNPYGLRTDQLARYWTSGHGKTLATKGDDRVAVCVDCHGAHEILPPQEPASKTHPLNVPDMCANCHSDMELMGEFGLPVEVVDEYRQSIHGRLLLQQHDTGAPNCATCHGNHSAMPPGFATVDAVCGRCHQSAAKAFATSIHAEQEEHKGCVQCHGGGEGRHYHLIERITKPTGLLIQRYARLLASEPTSTPQQIAESIHPGPKEIITRALPTCEMCHEEIDYDESLPKLFELMDEIAEAETYYAKTGLRLERVGQGVLLVDRQRFLFEDAKTHLIELAPLQHALDNKKVAAKVADLNAVCDQVNAELDELERGLHWRSKALVVIWIFAVLFSAVLYAKYKQLKAIYVKPLPEGGLPGI